MSFVDEGPRPGDSPIRDGRKPLGPGYDWLAEFFRQFNRPALGVVCILAMLNQIYAPVELRMDAMTFSFFILLAAALAGLRSFDLREARSSLA